MLEPSTIRVRVRWWIRLGDQSRGQRGLLDTTAQELLDSTTGMLSMMISMIRLGDQSRTHLSEVKGEIVVEGGGSERRKLLMRVRLVVSWRS